MKSNKSSRTLNITVRFTLMVFFISLLSGVLSTVIGAVLYAVGFINPGNINPLILIMLFFISSLIIGTFMAIPASRNSLEYITKLLSVVSEIGKGNFNVELEENMRGPERMRDIACNINIMARELKNVEIMRSDFIQNFSHEFKTPIVSIQGFAKRLLTKNLTEEQKKEYLNIILEESTRLTMLATNTLYMSKLDSMGYPNECKEFMLDEQIRQCILLMEKQWVKKHLDILVDVPEMKYSGNEEMLKQIWLNLLSNAIKFTPENGKIMITAVRKENGLIVSVSDNGIGMDEATVARIFDKYYQADTSHATEGNGLGLAIVKKIITLAGGEISVKSFVGSGSTFTVTLPIYNNN